VRPLPPLPLHCFRVSANRSRSRSGEDGEKMGQVLRKLLDVFFTKKLDMVRAG